MENEGGKSLVVSEESPNGPTLSEMSLHQNMTVKSDEQLDSDTEPEQVTTEQSKKNKKKSKKNKEKSKSKKAKKPKKKDSAQTGGDEESIEDVDDSVVVDEPNKQKLRDSQKNTIYSETHGDQCADENIEDDQEDKDCNEVNPDPKEDGQQDNILQSTIDKINALTESIKLARQSTVQLSFELPEFLEKAPTDEAQAHEEMIALAKQKSSEHNGPLKLSEEFFRKVNLRMKTSCHSGSYEDFVKKANGSEYSPIQVNEETLNKSIKKTLKTFTKEGPIELEIAFPMEPYTKQLDYMTYMLYSLSTSTHSVFESPAGSGKTLSNLVACLAWLKNEQDQGRNRHSKVFYAIKNLKAAPRIISQLKKTCYQPLISYIDTRMNLCNNKNLKGLSETEMGLKCLELRSGSGCPCYSADIAEKVVEFKKCITIPDLEEFVQFSKHGMTCGFYTGHHMLEDAQLVFITFEYLTNPVLLQTVQDYLRDSILLVDEATEIEWPATAGESLSITCRDIAKSVQELEPFKTRVPPVANKENLPPAPEDKSLVAVQAALVRFKANIVQRFISNKKVVCLETKEFLTMLHDAFLSVKKGEGETELSFDLQKSLAWYLNQINSTLVAKANKEQNPSEHKEFINLWKSFAFLKRSLQYYHDYYEKASKEVAGSPASISLLDHFAVLIEGVSQTVNGATEEDIKLSIHCMTGSFSLMRIINDCAPRCMFFVSSTIFPKNYFYSMYGVPFALTYQCQTHVLPLPQSQFIIRVSPLKVRFDDWKDPSKPGLELLGKSIIDLVRTLETTMEELHQHGGVKPPKQSKDNSQNKMVHTKTADNPLELRSIVVEKLNSGLLEKKTQQPIKQLEGRGYILCFCSGHARDQAFDYWKQNGVLETLQAIAPVFKDGISKKEAAKKELKADPDTLIKSNKKLDKFKRVIVSGKSAILMTDFNEEKLTERIDFIPAMSRIILFIGFPGTLLLKDRFGPFVKKYLDKMSELEKPIQVKDINDEWINCERLLGKDWGHNNSVRAINQSVGQAIRDKHDYGAVILVDDRYINTRRKIDGLCTWMTNSLQSPETPEKLVADVVSFFEKIGCNGETLMKSIQDEEERLKLHLPKDSTHSVNVLLPKMHAYDGMGYHGMRYHGMPPPGMMQQGVPGMRYYGDYQNSMGPGYSGAPKPYNNQGGGYGHPYYNNYGYGQPMAPGQNYYKSYDGKPVPNAYGMPPGYPNPNYPGAYYGGWSSGVYSNQSRPNYNPGYSSSNRAPYYGGRGYLHPNSYSHMRQQDYRSNRLGWGYQAEPYSRKPNQQRKTFDPTRSVGVDLLGVQADIPAEFANLGGSDPNPLKSPSTPSSPSSGSPARLRRMDHRPASYAIQAQYEKYRKLYQEREAAKNDANQDPNGVVGLQQSEVRGIMEKFRVNEVMEKVKKRDFLTTEKSVKEPNKDNIKEGSAGYGAIERTGDTSQTLIFRPRKCPIPDDDDEDELEDSDEEQQKNKKVRDDSKKVQTQGSTTQNEKPTTKRHLQPLELRRKELDEYERLKAELEETVKGKATLETKGSQMGGLRLLSKQVELGTESGDEEEGKSWLQKTTGRVKLNVQTEGVFESLGEKVSKLLGESEKPPESRVAVLH